MKYLVKDWKRRSAIILFVSLIISGFMWTIEFSSWAESVNSAAAAIEQHDREKSPPFLLMFFMSFVKLLVLTLVPFAVTYGLITLTNKVKKKKSLA